jgi:hypothetical protein
MGRTWRRPPPPQPPLPDKATQQILLLLHQLNGKLDKIMSQQDEINAAVAEIAAWHHPHPGPDRGAPGRQPGA